MTVQQDIRDEMVSALSTDLPDLAVFQNPHISSLESAIPAAVIEFETISVSRLLNGMEDYEADITVTVYTSADSGQAQCESYSDAVQASIMSNLDPVTNSLLVSIVYTTADYDYEFLPTAFGMTLRFSVGYR